MLQIVAENVVATVEDTSTGHLQKAREEKIIRGVDCKFFDNSGKRLHCSLHNHDLAEGDCFCSWAVLRTNWNPKRRKENE